MRKTSEMARLLDSKPCDNTGEMETLLEMTPVELPDMEGLQAKEQARDDSYAKELKPFFEAFSNAGHAFRPPESFNESAIPLGIGYYRQTSGFQSHVVSPHHDDVEAYQLARKIARQHEAEACANLMTMIQSQQFVAAVRKAQKAGETALLARLFNERKTRKGMILAVADPSIQAGSMWRGDGLPEILRRVVRCGQLAVAVWWAVVEHTTVRTQWNRVLRYHEKLHNSPLTMEDLNDE